MEKKKIVVIGDVHGESTWKDIVEKHTGCKYIFLGDYCDPYRHDITDEDVIANLCSIIDFKKLAPDDVVLLLGNHDIQYVYHEAEYCSRRMTHVEKQIANLLKTDISLFEWGYKVGKIIFTHAGISQGWFRFASDKADKSNIIKFITDPQNREIALACGFSRGGFAPFGGFFWADKRELTEPLNGYVQAVGHSRVPEIIFKKINDDTAIFFCDCLAMGKYLTIEQENDSLHFYESQLKDDKMTLLHTLQL
jgi:hypothetical protein